MRSRTSLLFVAVLAACRAKGPTSGEGFVAPRDLDAVDQPEGHRTVAHLRSGERYTLLKRGGPDRAWCKLDVGSEGGWVPCAGSEAAPPRSSAPSVPVGSTFAYWVLTLSWSPAFCETPAGAKSPDQCGEDRHYGFVVHGLWPQNEQGWPERCSNAQGPSPSLVKRMLDIMPSEHLVRHEWEKHGTCSGLAVDDYFDLVRRAFQSIRVPEAYVAPKEPFRTDLEHVESAFVAANPGLTGEAIAVECKRDLDEVRICLDRELRPRRCGADVRDACRGSVRVPPLR